MGTRYFKDHTQETTLYYTNMKVYTELMIQKYEDTFEKCRPANRLPDVPANSEIRNESGHKYRSIVASCLWLARSTRPDLLRSVCAYSSAIEYWTPEHTKSLTIFISYIKTYKDMHMEFTLGKNRSKDLRVVGDSDASLQEPKSISGSFIYMKDENNPKTLIPLMWQSKRQNCATASSTAAEYLAAGLATENLLRVSKAAKMIQLIPEAQIPELFVDSQPFLKGVARGFAPYESTYTQSSKAIRLRICELHDLQKSNGIRFSYVPTAKNRADPLTQIINVSLKEASWKKFGLVNPQQEEPKVTEDKPLEKDSFKQVKFNKILEDSIEIPAKGKKNKIPKKLIDKISGRRKLPFIVGLVSIMNVDSCSIYRHDHKFQNLGSRSVNLCEDSCVTQESACSSIYNCDNIFTDNSNVMGALYPTFELGGIFRNLYQICWNVVEKMNCQTKALGRKVLEELKSACAKDLKPDPKQKPTISEINNPEDDGRWDHHFRGLKKDKEVEYLCTSDQLLEGYIQTTIQQLEVLLLHQEERKRKLKEVCDVRQQVVISVYSLFNILRSDNEEDSIKLEESSLFSFPKLMNEQISLIQKFVNTKITILSAWQFFGIKTNTVELPNWREWKNFRTKLFKFVHPDRIHSIRDSMRLFLLPYFYFPEEEDLNEILNLIAKIWESNKVPIFIFQMISVIDEWFKAREAIDDEDKEPTTQEEIQRANERISKSNWNKLVQFVQSVNHKFEKYHDMKDFIKNEIKKEMSKAKTKLTKVRNLITSMWNHYETTLKDMERFYGNSMIHTLSYCNPIQLNLDITPMTIQRRYAYILNWPYELNKDQIKSEHLKQQVEARMNIRVHQKEESVLEAKVMKLDDLVSEATKYFQIKSSVIKSGNTWDEWLQEDYREGTTHVPTQLFLDELQQYKDIHEVTLSKQLSAGQRMFYRGLREAAKQHIHQDDTKILHLEKATQYSKQKLEIKLNNMIALGYNVTDENLIPIEDDHQIDDTEDVEMSAEENEHNQELQRLKMIVKIREDRLAETKKGKRISQKMLQNINTALSFDAYLRRKALKVKDLLKAKRIKKGKSTMTIPPLAPRAQVLDSKLKRSEVALLMKSTVKLHKKNICVKSAQRIRTHIQNRRLNTDVNNFLFQRQFPYSKEIDDHEQQPELSNVDRPDSVIAYALYYSFRMDFPQYDLKTIQEGPKEEPFLKQFPKSIKHSNNFKVLTINQFSCFELYGKVHVAFDKVSNIIRYTADDKTEPELANWFSKAHIRPEFQQNQRFEETSVGGIDDALETFVAHNNMHHLQIFNQMDDKWKDIICESIREDVTKTMRTKSDLSQIQYDCVFAAISVFQVEEAIEKEKKEEERRLEEERTKKEYENWVAQRPKWKTYPAPVPEPKNNFVQPLAQPKSAGRSRKPLQPQSQVYYQASVRRGKYTQEQWRQWKEWKNQPKKGAAEANRKFLEEGRERMRRLQKLNEDPKMAEWRNQWSKEDPGNIIKKLPEDRASESSADSSSSSSSNSEESYYSSSERICSYQRDCVCSYCT